MNLIVQKNINYNIQDFFNKIINLDYIDGVSLNVCVTKDDKIVVFNLASGNDELVKSIYKNTYQELKNLELVMLEDIVTYLNENKYQRKLMLNLIPIEYKCITEEESKALMVRINRYVSNLEAILKDKTNLDLYIHSTSRSLINILGEKQLKCHIGYAITTTDLSYLDVSYFVFSYEMINLVLIKQELEKQKKIFLYVGSAYEISSVFDYLKGDKMTDLAKEIYNKIYIMGDYPELLKKTFLD